MSPAAAAGGASSDVAAASAGDRRALVADLVAAPAPLLVVVDFDGTLAIGSRDPAAARITPSAQRALRHLAGLGTGVPPRVVVAVLTGRTVADVADRVRVGGIDYLGDHGLQQATLPRAGARGHDRAPRDHRRAVRSTP